MLYYGTARVPKAGVDWQTIHTDGGVAHALHYRTAQPHVLATSNHIRMVNVVAVIGGISVVLHDKAGFTVFEQKLNPLVFIFRLAEAAQLKNAPRFGTITRRMKASVIRGFARCHINMGPVLLRNIGRRVEGLELNA